MSILRGQDKAGGRYTQASRIFANLLIAAVIGVAAGVYLSPISKLPIHQQKAGWDYLLIKGQYMLGLYPKIIQWGKLPYQMNPDALLPAKQRRSGMHATTDPRRLNEYVLKIWNSIVWVKLEDSIAYVVVGLGVAVGLLILIFQMFGSGDGKRSLRRGTELVPARVLKRKASSLFRKPAFMIAGIPIPAGIEYQHLLFLGGSGTGKSQLFRQIMRQIKPEDRVIIYDPAGDFYSKFKDAGSLIINPFDKRTVKWNLMDEIQNPKVDCTSIANSLIQKSGKESNPFFVNAPRKALAHMLQIAVSEGRDFKQTWELLKTDAKAWNDILTRYNMQSASSVDPKASNQALGVHSTAQIAAAGLEYASDVGVDFSLRKWMRLDRPGKLFLTSREDFSEELAPMIALWVEIAARELLSGAANQKRRTFFMIDELASLQRMPQLLKLLAQGRKFGACVVCGTQSIGQLQSTYGREDAKALIDTLGTRMIARCVDPESADWSSKAIGEREIDETKVSENFGERMRGLNYNDNMVKEAAVMPSQIMQLPNLSGYLRIAGDLPVAKVKWKNDAMKPIAPAFIDIDESQSATHEYIGTPAVKPAPSVTEDALFSGYEARPETASSNVMDWF